MWIKICANSSLEDALLAAESGADAVGFVFAPSKRQVTSAQVAAITPHLPPAVERIGVFAGNGAERIVAAALESGLTAVQLHDKYDEALVEQLANRFTGSLGVIQVLHWSVGSGPDSSAAIESHLRKIATGGTIARVLIDSKVGAVSGGTGVSFDWEAAAEVFRNAPPALRLIAAGGLKPDSVADAIATLRPWGVDVASGVEASPGRKDAQKLAQFIRNARRVG